MPSDTYTQIRPGARFPFLARARATDVVSGMLLEGLTMHLTERGCCILSRRAPFSQGAKLLLEITKGGVSLRTRAFVVYNVKDHLMGLCFVEMTPSQTAILAGWLRARQPIQSTVD